MTFPRFLTSKSVMTFSALRCFKNFKIALRALYSWSRLTVHNLQRLKMSSKVIVVASFLLKVDVANTANYLFFQRYYQQCVILIRHV